MRLTTKKALTICRDLWTWLKDNPLSDKGDWPGWKEFGIESKPFAFWCPCCERVKRLVGKADAGSTQYWIWDSLACCGGTNGTIHYTRLCPMVKLWPRGCCDESSPFWQWERLNMPALNGSIDARTQRSHLAAQIADACRAELKKMEGED